MLERALTLPRWRSLLHLPALCALLLGGTSARAAPDPPPATQPAVPTTVPATQPAVAAPAPLAPAQLALAAAPARAPAAAAPAVTRAPKRIGPFGIASADGAWSLELGLAVQLRYTATAAESQDGDWPFAGVAEARRIRPTLRGTLLSKDLGYYLHLSTAPGSLELMDWYIDYRFSAKLQARVGQWKIPFTRYRIYSWKDLTFVEWPAITQYFGAERQLGIALHNGYEKPPRWEYELGLFSGPNARASHAVGLARLHGEVLENPSALADPGPRATLHPELVGHAAYNHGGINVATDTDFEGGALRFSAGLSAAWDLDPERYVDLSMRFAPELLVKVRGLSIFGAFYIGMARRGEQITQQRPAMYGALAQASYLLLPWLELSGRYALVDIDEKVRADAEARGKELVAGAADDEARALLAAQYKHAGRVRREQELTIGCNVYLVGRALKWQNDWSYLAHGYTTGLRAEVRYRSQLQLSF